MTDDDAGTPSIELHPIGVVRSSLRQRGDAPRQPDEGAPAAAIVIEDAYADALDGIAVGDVLVLVTWLHESARDTLRVHPRSDPNRPATGVFATRSPDRPNPIGLHRVTATGLDGTSIHVAECEAIDGTPVLDVKPALGPVDRR